MMSPLPFRLYQVPSSTNSNPNRRAAGETFVGLEFICTRTFLSPVYSCTRSARLSAILESHAFCRRLQYLGASLQCGALPSVEIWHEPSRRRASSWHTQRWRRPARLRRFRSSWCFSYIANGIFQQQPAKVLRAMQRPGLGGPIGTQALPGFWLIGVQLMATIRILFVSLGTALMLSACGELAKNTTSPSAPSQSAPSSPGQTPAKLPPL